MDPFFRYQKQNNDMTYILGARCVDGVVLVSDQKILRGNVPSYKEKLMQVLPSVIMGGAGTSGLIERFSDEIKTQVENQRITNDSQLLGFVEERSLELSQKYAPRVGGLEILIGVRAGIYAQLFNIVTERGFAEPVKEYVVIGSGVPYGSFLLEKLWNKNMTMIDFAKVAYMVINYVIDFKLDDSVGGDPKVWFMPDVLEPQSDMQKIDPKYNVRMPNSEELEEIKNYSGEMILKISQFLDELLHNKPISSVSK